AWPSNRVPPVSEPRLVLTERSRGGESRRGGIGTGRGKPTACRNIVRWSPGATGRNLLFPSFRRGAGKADSCYRAATGVADLAGGVFQGAGKADSCYRTATDSP